MADGQSRQSYQFTSHIRDVHRSDLVHEGASVLCLGIIGFLVFPDGETKQNLQVCERIVHHLLVGDSRGGNRHSLGDFNVLGAQGITWFKGPRLTVNSYDFVWGNFQEPVCWSAQPFTPMVDRHVADVLWLHIPDVVHRQRPMGSGPAALAQGTNHGKAILVSDSLAPAQSRVFIVKERLLESPPTDTDGQHTMNTVTAAELLLGLVLTTEQTNTTCDQTVSVNQDSAISHLQCVLESERPLKMPSLGTGKFKPLSTIVHAHLAVTLQVTFNCNSKNWWLSLVECEYCCIAQQAKKRGRPNQKSRYQECVEERILCIVYAEYVHMTFVHTPSC